MSTVDPAPVPLSPGQPRIVGDILCARMPACYVASRSNP